MEQRGTSPIPSAQVLPSHLIDIVLDCATSVKQAARLPGAPPAVVGRARRNRQRIERGRGKRRIGVAGGDGQIVVVHTELDDQALQSHGRRVVAERHRNDRPARRSVVEGAAKVIDAQANRLGEVRVLDGQLSRRRRGAEPGAVEGFGIAKCAGGDVGGQVVDRPLGAWRRRPTPFGFELVEKVGEGDGLRDGRVGRRVSAGMRSTLSRILGKNKY